MAQHRLFVALRPPHEVRSALLATMGGVAGARWQDEAQLHCTLRFIGEVEARVAEDVARALAGLRHPRVAVELAGLGSFDHKGRVHSLWAGIAPAAALRPLHDRVARLLTAAGIAPDGRAYRAHITLARFARSSAPPCDVAEHLPPPPRLAFTFDDVRLYESMLGPDGAHYETVARYPLG